MPNLKFPPSVEIKRALAAVTRAGIEIGSIEIHPTKITIYPRSAKGEKLSAYDLWKLSSGEDTEHVKHTDEKSVARPRNPRG